MLTRTKLRELVRQKLLNHTDVGEKVYNSFLLVSDKNIPLINIFTPSELSQDGMLIITLELTALVMADVEENAGDLADALCEQIRTVLRRFWEDSGEFTASYLGTDLLFDIEAVQPYAAAKITYQVEVLNEE